MLRKDLKAEIKILNMQLEQALKDYDEETTKIAKAIKYLGINENILKTCEVYDVNGIELYKILQGCDEDE